MTTDIARPVALPKTVSQATTVEQSRSVAEVQAAIFVAQQFPRDMRRAWAEMREACGRLALASRAFYSVPNRGSGKSVHLAVELARIWGNIDYGVKELSRDDNAAESEIQAYAWDQQTNVRSTRSLIVPHARMVKKDRVALTDLSDVYLNNQNVGARAMRECLFKVMPADFAAEAEDICRATLEKGDGQPLDKRIEAMIAAFAALGYGIDVPRMEARVGRKQGLWTAVEVRDLGIVYSSLKRGDLTADEAFPPPVVTPEEITSRKRRTPPPPPTDDDADQDPPHVWTLADLFARAELTDGPAQLRYACEVIGRSVGSLDDLSDGERRTLTQALANWIASDEPPAGGEPS